MGSKQPSPPPPKTYGPDDLSDEDRKYRERNWTAVVTGLAVSGYGLPLLPINYDPNWENDRPN